MNDLEHWLRTMQDTLSRNPEPAAAILYALKLGPALLRYCDDGATRQPNARCVALPFAAATTCLAALTAAANAPLRSCRGSLKLCIKAINITSKRAPRSVASALVLVLYFALTARNAGSHHLHDHISQPLICWVGVIVCMPV
jgi:hypothetical protein